MASSPPNLVAPLQQAFLQQFFSDQPEFFLTGGTALAGWYLFHRRSDDLDLFTVSDQAWSGARSRVRRVAAALDATLEEVRSEPGFHRYVLTPRSGASALVDCVRDQDLQIVTAKPVRDGICVDAIEDIICNKLAAIVSRTEIKDFVDLFCLHEKGYNLRKFVEPTQRKFGGIERGVLAASLSRFRLEASPEYMAAPLDPASVNAFLAGLAEDLALDAFPHAG